MSSLRKQSDEEEVVHAATEEIAEFITESEICSRTSFALSSNSEVSKSVGYKDSTFCFHSSDSEIHTLILFNSSSILGNLSQYFFGGDRSFLGMSHQVRIFTDFG